MYEYDPHRIERMIDRDRAPPNLAERHSDRLNEGIIGLVGGTVLTIGLGFAKHPIWGCVTGAMAIMSAYEVWQNRSLEATAQNEAAREAAMASAKSAKSATA